MVEWLQANKRKYEIANILGIPKSAVQHYAKKLDFEKQKKEKEGFFNVDLYLKNTSSI